MSLHYRKKYHCQKTDGNLKYVLLLMITDKVTQTIIYVSVVRIRFVLFRCIFIAFV